MAGRVQEPGLMESLKNPLWWIPIILVVGGAIAMTLYKSSRNNHSADFEFRGYVYDMDGGNLSKTGDTMDKVRNKRLKGAIGIGGLVVALFGDPVSGTLKVEDEKNPENIINWPVPERTLEYFHWNDYIVKEKGKSPAVFREGQQLKHFKFFRQDDVSASPDPNRDIASSNDETPDPAPAASASSGDPFGDTPAPAAGDPFSDPAPVAVVAPPAPSAPIGAPPAAAPPATEETVTALLANAKTLWETGQPQQAVTCCEQALTICRQLYPPNDPRIANLNQRVVAAKAMLAQGGGM